MKKIVLALALGLMFASTLPASPKCWSSRFKMNLVCHQGRAQGVVVGNCVLYLVSGPTAKDPDCTLVNACDGELYSLDVMKFQNNMRFFRFPN